MLPIKLFTLLLLVSALMGHAQDFRWQQRVEYTMTANLDVQAHRVAGTQRLVYYNNSPDTLSKVYFHLYFNAFQPGSMMDVRSRSLPDPDRRVMDRISKLSDAEIGYQHVQTLQQDGKDVNYSVNGTILEVTLARPIMPRTSRWGSKTHLRSVWGQRREAAACPDRPVPHRTLPNAR